MFANTCLRLFNIVSKNSELNSFLITFLFIIILSSCSGQNETLKNHEFSLDELIDELNIEQAEINFLIDKSDYKLSVCYDTLIIKEFPIVLGGNPTDDKLMQGDECTPEGEFKIISKYPHKSWSKFIWINYPNDQSWKKHNEAKNGLIPGSASIGGEIGIHGVPENMNALIDMKYNWTLGCISLKNEDIEEVYPFFSEESIIKIQK